MTQKQTCPFKREKNLFEKVFEKKEENGRNGYMLQWFWVNENEKK